MSATVRRVARTCVRGVVFAFLPFVAGQAPAQTFDSSAGALAVTRDAGPFDHPWAVAFLPDGAKLVTERSGALVLVEDGELRVVDGAPAVRASGQGGLLDVALSPDFGESGLLFLSYSEPFEDGAAATAVARAVLDRTGAPKLTDVEVIFRQKPPLTGGRHFGSRIVVAPDGMLFVTLGERGRRPAAQDLGTHLGKIARIAPDGAVPPDNPFAGRADARQEIWSYGHRNPQGATLHPETGALWTVEHGAAGGDEINRPEAGLNYGWPEISYGRHYSGGQIGRGSSAPGMEQPVHYWDPSIAPSGLAFYGGDLMPGWRGDLFVGALKDRHIARLDMEDGRVIGEERLFEDAFGRIRDVRSGPDGALWFLTDSPEGGLYRVAPAE